MIQTLARSTSVPSLVLIPLILLLGLGTTASGQTTSSQETRVRNADWNIVGDEIVVTYDLIGSEQGDYDVTVTFLNETRSVRLPLTAVTGDIGTVRGPAAGKTIKWSYKKDIPIGMSGDGFYFGFEVSFKGPTRASVKSESGGFPFVGLLLLIGVVAGVFVLTGKDE